MKRNIWAKIKAGLLVCAILAVSGPQIMNHTDVLSGNREEMELELPDDITIRKSGFGFQERSVTAYSTKAKAGPGERMLGGAKLTLLSNQTASQMLSVVIQTSKGSLIVIDGGTPGDSAYLLDTIRAKGGKVAAWLITHPHSDHVGALTEIINHPDSQITIENIYYSFADPAWYRANEDYRADTVEKLVKSFESVPAKNLHGDIKKGQEILVDNIKITVMNNPYLFENNAINNSSVAYKLLINGKTILFLGDMGVEAGDRLVADLTKEELKSDILQMAHHGQAGVSQQVYEAIAPKICLWPTPDWLWNNDNGGGPESGPWSTSQTKIWMDQIGVNMNYIIKDGDQTLE